jgi:FlaA1/EpsC-like NDP-sugar epimerase
VYQRLCNVTDAAAVERIFEEFSPQTIFHAAAYKHVPLMEENVLSGVHNNLFGTLTLADAAVRAEVERFILISTDKAVRPPNVMGASKRACELVLQAFADSGCDTIFTMVRFGNVLDSSGSVIPLFRRQIASGGPVTVTHREITRYFMTIPEAAELVIQAAGLAIGGEVFVLDMGEPVKIWDLARTMIHLAGLTVRDGDLQDGDVEVVETGLRPGEKLYEELLIADDPSPTAHPRILRARETFIPMAKLGFHLAAIAKTLECGEADACRAELKKLVPSLVGSSAPAVPERTSGASHPLEVIATDRALRGGRS